MPDCRAKGYQNSYAQQYNSHENPSLRAKTPDVPYLLHPGNDAEQEAECDNILGSCNVVLAPSLHVLFAKYGLTIDQHQCIRVDGKQAVRDISHGNGRDGGQGN